MTTDRSSRGYAPRRHGPAAPADLAHGLHSLAHGVPLHTQITSAAHGARAQEDWPILHPLAELPAAIEDARLRAVFNHWLAARGGRTMPAWRDIDPLQLGPQLSHMWSLRYDQAEDSFTGRLSGEEINAIFGKSLRQTRIEDFFAPDDVPWIHERCLRIIATPCIALVSGPVYAYTGRYGSGCRIMLPLGETAPGESASGESASGGDGVIGNEVMGATVYHLQPPGAGPIGSEMTAADSVERVRYFAI